jgi:hypothetical protein
VTLQTEQKYTVLLEYAKASFERIKQRLRHLWALARAKRVLNDYTLALPASRAHANDIVRPFLADLANRV